MISQALDRKDGILRPVDPQEYRHIRVWQRAMELARKILSVTDRLPVFDEILSRGIRETALQIPTEIAAGYSRGSRAEFVRMLTMARGHLAVLDTQCMLAHQLGVMDLPTRRQIEVLIIETTHLIDQGIETS